MYLELVRGDGDGETRSIFSPTEAGIVESVKEFLFLLA